MLRLRHAPELPAVERARDGERFRLVVNLSERPVTYEGGGRIDLPGGADRTLAPWRTVMFALD